MFYINSTQQTFTATFGKLLPLLTVLKVGNSFSLEILINFWAEFLLQTIAVESKEAFQSIPGTG
jgi:Holliday junction resolvasome RuvABC DNA-binding subunit